MENQPHDIFESTLHQTPIVPESPIPTELSSPNSLTPFYKKKYWIVIFIIGLLLLGGGGVLAYRYFFPSSDTVLKKMAQNITTITSIEYSGDLKFIVDKSALKSNVLLPLDDSAANKKSDTFTLSFTGASNFHAADNPQRSFAFTAQSDIFKDKINFGLEFRAIKKAFYIRLTTAPDLGIIDLKPIENIWVTSGEKDVVDDFNLEKFTEEKDNIKNKLTPDRMAQLRNAFFIAQVFKITETLPTEVIEGRKTFHYRYTIDLQGIKRFSIEAKRILEEPPFTTDELTKIDEEIAKMDTLGGEIWIGKKDFLPYKLTLNSTIKNINDSGGGMTIENTLIVKNYNQPLALETPSEAKSFEELVAMLFSDEALMKAMQKEAGSMDEEAEVDFEKDSDGDGLPDGMEKVFETDPQKADTDGDGYKDGEEVENGFNPLGPGRLE